MKKFTKSEIIGLIMLLICTMIWGLAFVAQKKCADNGVTAFYLNGIRFLIAGLILFPLAIVMTKKDNKKASVKLTIFAGVIVGIALGFGTNVQQFGIEKTTPGKAGFLTAMYIIYVPLFSLIVFRKKVNFKQIIGIILAVVGVGLLSLDNDFSVNLGDALCLLCGIFFAIQILLVDKFVKKINTFMLSSISFITSGIIALALAIPLDTFSAEAIGNSILPIAFLAICSSCIAYTLQNLGQERIDGTPASLVMSLESVFSLIFSMIILNEMLSIKEWIGCILLLIGVIVVQIFENKNNASKDVDELNP